MKFFSISIMLFLSTFANSSQISKEVYPVPLQLSSGCENYNVYSQDHINFRKCVIELSDKIVKFNDILKLCTGYNNVVPIETCQHTVRSLKVIYPLHNLSLIHI